MGREVMDSGTEFALQALQSQIKVYTEGVGDRMREFGSRFDKFSEKLDAHVLEERAWQSRMEGKVTQALAYGDRIDKLELLVNAHERVFQQGQGAMWVSKVLWLVMGVLASTLVWGYATFVEPRSHTASAASPAKSHAAEAEASAHTLGHPSSPAASAPNSSDEP